MNGKKIHKNFEAITERIKLNLLHTYAYRLWYELTSSEFKFNEEKSSSVKFYIKT